MLTEYDCNVVGRDQINLCYALTIESDEDNGYANYLTKGQNRRYTNTRQ